MSTKGLDVRVMTAPLLKEMEVGRMEGRAWEVMMAVAVLQEMAVVVVAVLVVMGMVVDVVVMVGVAVVDAEVDVEEDVVVVVAGKADGGKSVISLVHIHITV